MRKNGELFVWLSGSAVSLALVLVVGLFGLILVSGLSSFWPGRVERLELGSGVKLGTIVETEVRRDSNATNSNEMRLLLKQGNRDLYGEDFVWINEKEIVSRSQPNDVIALERMEWGLFLGVPKSLERGGAIIAADVEETLAELPALLGRAKVQRERMERISKHEIGAVNRRQESLRLHAKSLPSDSPERAEIEKTQAALAKRYALLEAELNAVRNEDAGTLVVRTADGQEKRVAVLDVVRAFAPNRLSALQRLGIYIGRIMEFLLANPRESNTEGGVFPAIFGTVMVVFLMTIFVTPLGVLAAIYLREYAKQGTFVSLVRIAVNNLAGVPSIVFGVFGVGFFVYFLGGNIDRLFFAESLPTPTFGTGGILWASLTLALLTVPTVIVATEEGLAAIPRHLREGSYALGATRFETTWRVVIPSLTPSILTGMILAVARAAGEVAPLMITGVVKLAPSLPLDGEFPFFHLDRKFMHLGFHIFDVGFQSPNVEAARPMVFATTLLLLLIVVMLNLTALVVRNRLRRRFAGSAV